MAGWLAIMILSLLAMFFIALNILNISQRTGIICCGIYGFIVENHIINNQCVINYQTGGIGIVTDKPLNTALVTGTCALVSGATGFFGGHLVAALQAHGFRVRALARKTSDITKLTALGIEIVYGDLNDSESLQKAAAGQRYVFHTAGKVSDWGARHEFFTANEGGTASVIDACKRAGVERLVHISSLTVLGLPRDGRTVDETTPYDTDARDAYSASKIAGERLALSAHGQSGLSVTVVRPGVIWGTGDITIIPRFAALLRRGVMVYPGGGQNLIAMSHVRNLATGAILAAQTATAGGQIYHITDGEELTARQALVSLAHAVGVPPPRLSVPYWVMYGIGAMMELAAKAMGRVEPPAITRYAVRLVSCHCRYNLDKASSGLGYVPLVNFRTGIVELARDFTPGFPHSRTTKGV